MVPSLKKVNSAPEERWEMGMSLLFIRQTSDGYDDIHPQPPILWFNRVPPNAWGVG